MIKFLYIFSIVFTFSFSGCGNSSTSEDNALIKSNQIWRGSYVCSQGLTNLDLSITSEKNNKIQAVFSFNYNNQAIGSFNMEGVFVPSTRKLTLKPTTWIEQPANYETVEMIGIVNSEGSEYSGEIYSELVTDCETFDVFLVK